jgi:hypothetical protein
LTIYIHPTSYFAIRNFSKKYALIFRRVYALRNKSTFFLSPSLKNTHTNKTTHKRRARARITRWTYNDDERFSRKRTRERVCCRCEFNADFKNKKKEGSIEKEEEGKEEEDKEEDKEEEEEEEKKKRRRRWRRRKKGRRRWRRRKKRRRRRAISQPWSCYSTM